jgi:Potential Queuosine, Q, salvage protein family
MRGIRFALFDLKPLQVPQILHSLGVLSYSPCLEEKLRSKEMLPYGSSLESSIRAGSIIAVEEIKARMETQSIDSHNFNHDGSRIRFNSVLIDFFLWDLTKLVESGEQTIESTVAVLPCHRTRSIYY